MQCGEEEEGPVGRRRGRLLFEGRGEAHAIRLAPSAGNPDPKDPAPRPALGVRSHAALGLIIFDVWPRSHRGSSDPGQSRPGSVKLAGSCKLLQYPLKAPETQCTSVAERQASPRPVLPSGRRRPPQSGWGAASRGQTGASGQSLANGWRPCVRSVAVASRAC